MMACVLCNDSVLQKEEGEWVILGDPTEGALLAVAGKAGLQKDEQTFKFPRVSEFPFSSERKRMSVIVQNQEGGPSSWQMFTKGSPELTLERCTHAQSDRRNCVSAF
jgi:P-type Ca2+ transporter type 2C